MYRFDEDSYSTQNTVQAGPTGLAAHGGHGTDQAVDWLGEHRRASGLSVDRISFADSQQWSIREGALRHHTGRFFSVEGLHARSRFPGLEDWVQPIINQPEVGILGFLAQRRNGSWRLLVQAKTEPGNVGGVQMAPTLQATESNYTLAHQGLPPAYLDFFLGRPPGSVLVDQLQSEQGSRFLRKRNRNMVIEVPPQAEIEHTDEFRWMALSTLHDILERDNLINTDARSVISCLPWRFLTDDEELSARHGRAGEFRQALRSSIQANDEQACQPVAQALALMTELRVRYGLHVQRLPLDAVESWQMGPQEIVHRAGREFSVVQMSVHAEGREVPQWDQPIVETVHQGLCAFVCQRRKGVLHFLVQARVEPGCFDVLELTTTVQCIPEDHDPAELERLHPLAHWVMQAPRDRIRLETNQSEEGGRFFRDSNRYLVVEASESETLDLRDNFLWLTLSQIEHLMRFNNLVTNEARSLLACLRV